MERNIRQDKENLQEEIKNLIYLFNKAHPNHYVSDLSLTIEGFEVGNVAYTSLNIEVKVK